MDNKIIWIVLGVLLLAGISTAIGRLRNDIKHTDSTLDKVEKEIGVSGQPLDDEIKALILEGKKIKAIKRYREVTGVGLKEAKDYIDKLI